MFEITLKFLEAVRLNNSTEWLHTHWDLYQQEKKRFTQFIDVFLKEAKKLNPLLEDLELKECLYRFNKDLRFSRDAKPYKENFWAIVTYGGKKSDFPCFYFSKNRNSNPRNSHSCLLQGWQTYLTCSVYLIYRWIGSIIDSVLGMDRWNYSHHWWSAILVKLKTFPNRRIILY